MKQPLEIYIHIPFCVKKCNYCDFLSFPSDRNSIYAYMCQLVTELAGTARLCSGYEVSSVFIGGGTPSLIEEEYITAVLDTVRKRYRMSDRAEITIECNPGTLTAGKLAAYKEVGINRLSIGLQSADNAELKMLGRIHTFEDFLKSYQAARMQGFDNINVDLINCIPMQTLKNWKKTLKSVLMLKPEHVSVYNLIVEEGTPFCEMEKNGLLMLPDEDTQAEIDQYTREYLEKQGYGRYEISNWARKGRECAHNKGYWTGVSYLGFGLGASSYFEGYRWSNSRSMDEYMKADFNDLENSTALIRKDMRRIDRKAAMEEFMFLGLRLVEGISTTRFLTQFGQRIESVYGDKLDKFIEEGFMTGNEFNYRFTERGMDVSNQLLSEFLLE